MGRPCSSSWRPANSTFHLALPVWELVARGVLIYLCLLAALRVFGKRQLGQFTLFDLVFVLLVVNALQPAMTGPDTSVVGGLVLIATLVVLNFGISRLDRIAWFHRLFSPAPAVIVRDGKFQADVLRKEGMTKDEIEMAMREHGVDKMSDVEEAVLESDGSISVVPKEGAAHHRPKRRVRFIRRY